MLEVALHNPRQHKQLRGGCGPLVLARSSREPALWEAVNEVEVGTESYIDIAPQLAGIALTVAGRETEYRELPTSFVVGDTRFEIVRPDACALHRPLQPLRIDKRSLRSNKSSPVGPSPATLSRWFSALSSLNHWA